VKIRRTRAALTFHKHSEYCCSKKH